VGEFLGRFEVERRPNVVFFIGEEMMHGRLAWMERQVGPLDRIDSAEPGLLDRIMHGLNPVNRNETIAIFRIREERP
jgi:hypothetical protein